MTAAQIESAGLVCPLVTDIDALADLPDAAGAVVLARRLRLAKPDVARTEALAAARAFARLEARQVYYKYCATFDSTPDGAIGPVAETLAEALKAETVIFAPAFVQLGVIVREGCMLIGETPLSETAKRHDPVTPMTNSNLVEVLQAQTSEPVGLLTRTEFSLGPGALARSAARFFIADAETEADIEALAGIAAAAPLVTGADSLAPALARRHRAGAAPQAGTGRRLLEPSPGGEAVLAGSCAGMTLRQLRRFEETHPVYRVDLAAEGDDPGLVERILAWAVPRLSAGPLAIATSADREAVGASQAKFGRDGAAQRADRILAACAKGLHAAGVRRFVTAGGETSGAVLGALGVRRVAVAGYDNLLGGYCRNETGESFVVKAGGLGGVDFFDEALARMREAAA